MNESVNKQVKKFLPEVVHLSLQCFSYLFYFCKFPNQTKNRITAF